MSWTPVASELRLTASSAVVVGAAGADALLAVAACSSGPRDGSTAQSARDAIVDVVGAELVA